MLTAFGAAAVTLMAAAYAFEHRHRSFVLAFACGCALASTYAFLASAWPLGLVEALWALLALRRFQWRGHAGSRRRGLQSDTSYNRGLKRDAARARNALGHSVGHFGRVNNGSIGH